MWSHSKKGKVVVRSSLLFQTHENYQNTQHNSRSTRHALPTSPQMLGTQLKILWSFSSILCNNKELNKMDIVRQYGE